MSFRRRSFRDLIPAMIAAALLLTAALPSADETGLDPFSEIHSGVLGDYATYQLKFTYLGFQKKDVGSLGGVGTGRAFDAPSFIPFERAFDYSNDDFTGDTLLLSAVEFKAFVDSIAGRPALQDTALVAEPNASLMILRDSGPLTRCWEHLATRAETDTLFQLLHDSVADSLVREKVHSYRRQMAGIRR